MDKKVDKTIQNAKKLISDVKKNTDALDETVKGAVIGGILGYLVSDKNKERNTVVGASVGYVAGRVVKGKKKNF